MVLTYEDFMQRTGVPNYHDTAVTVCGVFGQLNTPHADDETNPEYAPAANQHCTLNFIMTLVTQALHHSTQNTPNPPTQPMFQLPAHPTVLSTATSHCHYSNCPPTLKPSAALHDQRACALTQTRPTCTVVVTKKKSRRGEGNSLSFVCVLATLKPNTPSCTTNLRVQTANYYFTYRFFLEVVTKY